MLGNPKYYCIPYLPVPKIATLFLCTGPTAGYGTTEAQVCQSYARVETLNPSSLLPGGFISRQTLQVFWVFFLCFSLASWQGRFQEFPPEVMAPCLEKWSACSMSTCLQFSSKERQHQVFPAQLLCLAFPCVAISCQEKEVSS